jgi:hypothetical protein
MVGYNIIIAETAAGEPVRLLNEHVLNGSILLILISCTVSSFISMSSAQRIAETQSEETLSGNIHEQENILMAINYEATVEKMVNLGLLIKAEGNDDHLVALNVINESKKESSIKNAEKIIDQAVDIAAAADVKLQRLIRYDNDVINGINNVIKEQKISDLIIGLQEEKGFSSSFVHNLYNGYLQNANVNLLIYHAAQPISTLKKYTVLIPEKAEQEAGFFHALLRIWNIGRNSGAFMSFYTSQITADVLKRIVKKATIEAEFNLVQHWDEAKRAALDIGEDEGLIVLMAKEGMISYFSQLRDIPSFLNQRLSDKNYLLIYPFSEYETDITEKRSLTNHADFVEIGKVIGRIFK